MVVAVFAGKWFRDIYLFGTIHGAILGTIALLLDVGSFALGLIDRLDSVVVVLGVVLCTS